MIFSLVNEIMMTVYKKKYIYIYKKKTITVDNGQSN